MTYEKARDFFSAYYEGSLEPGLCVSFEQKLKTDANLKDEYNSFASAMGELDVLKLEEIEIPFDLHERISARLDRDIFDRKRTAQPLWSSWLRGLAFAGVGALAIFGAILALNTRGGQVNTAGAISAPAKERIDYSASGQGVTFKFKPAKVRTVVVSDVDGKEMNRTTVGDAATPELKTLLANPQATATVFQIQVLGESSSTYIAIPGKIRSSINQGEGTVIDLAKALAGYYRVPVSIETVSPKERTTWSFTSPEIVSETSRALGSNYSVTLMDKGLLEIERK